MTGFNDAVRSDWRDDLIVLADHLRTVPRIAEAASRSPGVTERCQDCHLPLHGGKERHYALLADEVTIVRILVPHDRCTGLAPAYVDVLPYRGQLR